MKIYNHRSFAALYFVVDENGHVIADGLSMSAAMQFVKNQKIQKETK